MGKLVQGPFDVKWGDNSLQDVSEVSVDYSQDSNDYDTIDRRRYSIDGPIVVTVSVTLLKSDVPALAVVLPQFYIANGQQMSTGETVNDANGAIDVVAASCENESVYHNLDLISCGNNAEVMRLVNARTKIDSMELADNSVRTVTIMFIGEPDAGEATLQFMRQNSLQVVS